MSDALTSNLSAELRNPAYNDESDGHVRLRAADEIDRLTADLRAEERGQDNLRREIDRLTADNKVLREALVGAVDCIREWHNMGVPQKERSQLWDIYWRNAPEMKAIRAALEGVKP